MKNDANGTLHKDMRVNLLQTVCGNGFIATITATATTTTTTTTTTTNIIAFGVCAGGCCYGESMFGLSFEFAMKIDITTS
jgi:hypothetical protein